jgi:hypothetical protein
MMPLRRLVRGILCAVALWGAACGGPLPQAVGYETLAQFLGGGETLEAEDLPGAAADGEPLGDSLLHDDSPLQGHRALQPIAGRSASPLATHPVYGDDHFGVPPDDGSQQMMMGNRPIGWISGPYLRYGVDFVVGEGVLEGGQKLGWGINGGFRQPLAPGLAPGRMFFDLGGGYLSAVGNTNRILPGLATHIDGSTTTVANAYSVNLTEVKRAGVNVALGWYWGDAIDDRSQDPQLRFATRFGGRYGSVRGRFLEERIVALPVLATSMKTTYLNTDTFGGLFLGTEAILLNRNFSTCNVQWTADVEFANDWIEFGGFDSGSLGTASLMTGIMLSR